MQGKQKPTEKTTPKIERQSIDKKLKHDYDFGRLSERQLVFKTAADSSQNRHMSEETNPRNLAPLLPVPVPMVPMVPLDPIGLQIMRRKHTSVKLSPRLNVVLFQ
jgi:hypothetical protein